MDNNDFNNYAYNGDSQFEKPKNNKKISFGRSIVVPFISGIVGASLVVGTCFGIPDIRKKVLGYKPTSYLSTSVQSTTPNTIDVVNMSEFSDTSINVAQKVLPSIVGINVQYDVSSIFGNSTAEATGSGIIISEDGYIVTNNHVISSESKSSYYEITKATEITLNLYNDKTEYKATVIGTDPYTDLAVIKIDATGLTAATIGNSDNIKVGEFAMAIGNPLGMQSSVTSGIISAVNREVTSNDGTTYVAIQTDAAINSGNSGGALVNAKGEVIGINTLKLSGTGVEGIGFAIPINSTTNVISQLIEFKEVKRPSIGISGSAVSDQIAKRYNVPVGVYVESVDSKSGAEAAGLKAGDIITKIEGTEVKNVQELNKIKNNYSIGDEVTLTVYSNNEYKDIKVKLQEQVTTTTEKSEKPETKKDNSTKRSETIPSNPFGDSSIFDYFFN